MSISNVRVSTPLFLLASVVLAVGFAGGALGQDPGQVDVGGDLRGGDVSVGAGGRDNTRVQGTVFDSSGQPMPEVQIWAQNHNAPADRVRGRTRKTGSYLVRNLIRLYTRDDVYGLTMRMRFEKAGYKTVEAVADVEKNGLTRLFPIMYREDEEPKLSGFCAVLTGTVANAKGKGIKGATVKVTGGDFAAETTTVGGGEYEVVLWNAPGEVTVMVDSAKGSRQTAVTIQPAPRPDVLIPQTHDVTID